ncbi:MAG: HEAT repeat domain-containing protein [Janthinobacterium lividum]
MKIQIGTLTSIALLLFPCIKAECQLSPAKPLQETILASTTIVVCRLTKFTAEPSQDVLMKPAGTTPNGIPYYIGNKLVINAIDSVNPPGTYEFDVIQTIKGEMKTHLSVSLPNVLAFSYGDYMTSKPTVAIGGKFLLLLKLSSTGYSPTDLRLPLIPIPADASTGNSDTTTMQVANLLLPSGPDSALRLADSYLLRTLTSPNLVMKLVPFLTDRNIYVRDNVLACLAANQQVAVIPKIVQLSANSKFRDHPSNAVPALQSFVVPDAIPYLNPLVFNNGYDIRTHTMYALYKVADSSSIPYLIMALRDPDPEKNIPAGAYVALRRLIPVLGPYTPQSQTEFVQKFNIEIKPINAWWSDELLGKHLKPGEHPAIPAELPNTPALLNTLLFIPDTPTRRAVADKLARLGDKSSIPYLILALQDPDPQPSGGSVSYVAYKTLHRLIPSLGTVRDSDSFTANHDAATQPIYDWWRDELLEKHLPKQRTLLGVDGHF